MSAIHYYPQRSNRDFGVAFAANGQYLPCSDANGNPREFDLFSSANGWQAANNPSLYPKSAGSTPTIDKLGAYMMSGDFTLIDSRYANQNNACNVNQGGAQIGGELNNSATTPVRHFFY